MFVCFFFFLLFILFFYFIFKLYIIVLVLPNVSQSFLLFEIKDVLLIQFSYTSKNLNLSLEKKKKSMILPLCSIAGVSLSVVYPLSGITCRNGSMKHQIMAEREAKMEFIVHFT